MSREISLVCNLTEEFVEKIAQIVSFKIRIEFVLIELREFCVAI